MSNRDQPRCIYCGKFVPYDKRITKFNYWQTWNPIWEDVIDHFEAYHKKCKTKELKTHEI